MKIDTDLLMTELEAYNTWMNNQTDRFLCRTTELFVEDINDINEEYLSHNFIPEVILHKNWYEIPQQLFGDFTNYLYRGAL